MKDTYPNIIVQNYVLLHLGATWYLLSKTDVFVISSLNRGLNFAIVIFVSLIVGTLVSIIIKKCIGKK
jgi:hypothetical protein